MSLIQPHLHWSYLHLCCQFTLSFLSYIHLESDWLKRSLSGYNSMSLGRFGRLVRREREGKTRTYLFLLVKRRGANSKWSFDMCCGCGGPLLNTGNGEGEGESNALFSEIWAAPTTFDSWFNSIHKCIFTGSGKNRVFVCPWVRECLSASRSFLDHFTKPTRASFWSI